MTSLQTVFSTVLTMSLAAGYIICILLIVRLFLKKMPKVFSYVLWFAVLFRLLCPITFQSGLSLLNGLYSSPAVENIADTGFLPKGYGANGISDLHQAGSISADLTAVPDSPSEAEPGTGDRNTGDTSGILGYFPLIWLFGMSALLSLSVISYAGLKKRLSTAVKITDNIYQTDAIMTPFVCGFFHPRIYLPPGLDERTKSCILLHENTHISRKDHIVKLLFFLALSIHWFNPLVWLAFYCMSRDMEMACDERVLELLSPKEGLAYTKRDYSMSLLSLADRSLPFLYAPLSFSEHPAKSRIKNILAYKRPSFWVMAVLGILCVLVIVSCASNPAAREEKAENQEAASPSPTPYMEEEAPKTEENTEEPITASYVTSPDEVSAVVPGISQHEASPFADNEKVINQLIYNSILTNMSGRYMLYEYSTAAFANLGSQEHQNSGNVKDTLELYIIFSYGSYRLIDNVFCKAGGTGNIPAVITIECSEDNIKEQTTFRIIDFRLPDDGMKWKKTIQELFPEDLWNPIFTFEGTQELDEEMNANAADYLKSIGMGEISVESDFQRKSFPLSEEMNKLLVTIFSNYPDWNGSSSTYINRERFYYTTSFTDCGNDIYLVDYKKQDDKETVLESYMVLLNKNQLIFIDKAPVLPEYAMTQEAVQIKTAQQLRGYIDDFPAKTAAYITIDEIRWLVNGNPDDEQRIKELGLNTSPSNNPDLPNGFYIDNPDTTLTSYEMEPDAPLIILKNHNGPHKSVNPSKFQKHYEAYKNTIPYILLIENGRTVGIIECYIP